jgi:hypothetical protein
MTLDCDQQTPILQLAIEGTRENLNTDPDIHAAANDVWGNELARNASLPLVEEDKRQ